MEKGSLTTTRLTSEQRTAAEPSKLGLLEGSLFLLQLDASLGTDTWAPSCQQHTEDMASLRTAGAKPKVAKPTMVRPYFGVQIIFDTGC